MGKFRFLHFLREQWTELPISTADVSDKSLVVVGANVGLGNEAAVHLAQLSPKSLLITSRDEAKCEGSKADVETRSGMTDIESWPLELCSFDSVRSFVNRFEAKGCTVDALIANAGIVTIKYAKTPDGYETSLQVNYLSTALLSTIDAAHLNKTGTPENPSRLVIVTSAVHYLANRLEGADKWPSIIDKKRRGVLYLFAGSIYKGLMARTTDMGSRTLVHAAIEPVRGNGMVTTCRAVRLQRSDYALSVEGREVSKRLWYETIKILGDIDPRVRTIMSEYLIQD
ncbi:short-chain dehydrogenase [Suillus paluster]|uniref:short-chain dehydrogenase n=1 Tax=Suillus paluster TaxID=48578 RepID=UPI001B86968F|nr:short-chain dehydrogenase [Suillus paluster]KAG1741916.1 short-chain dehydrogenase [Suillus paluster]